MENIIKKILVIDDNDDNQLIFKTLFLKAFPTIKLICSSSGHEGLSIVHNELPDVILLAILMPDMDGYEVCSVLKSDQVLKNIPVVMITAEKADKECRIKALEYGADAFLTKPVDESEFKAQIRAMLRLKDAEDARHDEKQQLEELVRQRTETLEKELGQCKITETKLQIAFNELERRRKTCLLYTSDAADEEDSVDLGGRRIIKKKKKK